MRAFHFYIDDWLSSKHVRRMDAHEERGYLRLLLYAASEPDCGLPNDPDELADISLLGPQWSEPTKDSAKRFRNQTSGEKLLACFFEQDGRLYNTRLLKEFEYQREMNRKRSEASKKGVAARQKTGPDDQTVDQVVDRMVDQTVEQNTTNDVWVCVTGSVSNNSLSTEEVQSLELVKTAAPVFFERWWQDWSAVRGTNHKIQAAHAWISIDGNARAPDIFACTESYLSSLENPAKGYNPENFLFQQSRDGFTARWPPSRASPRAPSKKEIADRDFDRRMLKKANERGLTA